MISNMPRYEQMKDSGVEWLGEIPEHWTVLQGKRAHKNKKELNSLKQCSNILSLTLRGVVNNDPDNPEGLIPKDYGSYQIFEKNDLVFKLIDLENLKTSRVGLVHEKGIMSSAYIRLIVGLEFFPKYAFYYYYNLYLNAVYNNLGAGVRSTLSSTDLLDIFVIAPPFPEQTAISTFIDQKTAKIDQAITLKQKQIELFKERKQLVIQQAVTKGLNPDAPMRDSGVEWIGEIPEHWKVKRLKYVLDERNERSKKGEEPLFMVSQVHGLVVRSEYHAKAEVAQSTIDNKIVHKNDLVFNKLKAHLGVFFKSTIEFNGIVSPDYAVYKPKAFIDDLKYLEYLFRHPAYIGQFIIKATGIVEGLIRLYTTALFEIPIPIPSSIEQKNILSFIETQSAKIDKAIDIQQQQINKLKEYKATLINSAVTGKIKVV